MRRVVLYWVILIITKKEHLLSKFNFYTISLLSEVFDYNSNMAVKYRK